MENEDLKYWFALRFAEGVGNVSFRHLVDSLGSPREAFRAGPERIESAIPGFKKQTALNIADFRDWDRVNREIALAEKLGISILRYTDADYPRALLNIYDFPPLLYVRGEVRSSDINIAIVGSRAASTYGRFAAERLARELACSGATVVSGLARGIDTAAHRGALAARGRTIAVLGCGIDVIYPPENAELYQAIPRSGAIVSEFPFGTPPSASNFPARNRIISGLSLGVVVVEATEKSGSLITAGTALEQGREVFAVPGIIDSPGSRGTHKLLKQGAKLVENAGDILEEVLPQVARPAAPAQADPAREESRPRPQKATAEPVLSPAEMALLEELSGGPRDVDFLICHTGLPAGETLGLLTGLELHGCITRLPGRIFTLKTD